MIDTCQGSPKGYPSRRFTQEELDEIHSQDIDIFLAKYGGKSTFKGGKCKTKS